MQWSAAAVKSGGKAIAWPEILADLNAGNFQEITVKTEAADV